jgi:hypothetical protein
MFLLACIGDPPMKTLSSCTRILDTFVIKRKGEKQNTKIKIKNKNKNKKNSL